MIRRLFLFLSIVFLLTGAVPPAPAQAEAASPTAAPVSSAATADRAAADRTAAAAAVSQPPPNPQNQFLERLVDDVLALFNVTSSGNTTTHYVVAAVLLLAGLLARRIVALVLFPILKKVAARTKTTLDDKLFPALEAPVGAFVMLIGIFGALRVLKLSASTDDAISVGSQVAFSLAIYWIFWRALQAVLDHAAEVSKKRQLSVAAFMPWIKKSLMTVFVIFGVLLTIQSLGYDVKTLLAGLGIGGLAFALAAQDTLANVFGAIVVAVDQPFKLGEVVRIQGNVGFIEDIGVRSTRIRLLDKSLMVIPNKTVAAETITNLSRFTGRRVEQVIGLTYDTTAAQMEEVVAEFRRLILAEEEVDPTSVICYFRDYSASSLDIWMVFVVKDPDFHKHMALRQRLSLAMMRTVEARGLSFAFPTQTVHVASLPAAKSIE